MDKVCLPFVVRVEREEANQQGASADIYVPSNLLCLLQNIEHTLTDDMVQRIQALIEEVFTNKGGPWQRLGSTPL